MPKHKKYVCENWYYTVLNMMSVLKVITFVYFCPMATSILKLDKNSMDKNGNLKHCIPLACGWPV